MGKLQQPVHLTVFHLFGLILAGVCASGLAKDGWAERGYVGLLGGLIIGALAFAPIEGSFPARAFLAGLAIAYY